MYTSEGEGWRGEGVKGWRGEGEGVKEEGGRKKGIYLPFKEGEIGSYITFEGRKNRWKIDENTGSYEKNDLVYEKGSL